MGNFICFRHFVRVLFYLLTATVQSWGSLGGSCPSHAGDAEHLSGTATRCIVDDFEYRFSHATV